MRNSMIGACLLVAALALQVSDVDAKRLGGSRSLGAQRQAAPPASSSTSPSGAASNPVLPAQPGASAGAAATTLTQASGASRWLAPLAGIAAGLGLAALLSHFGLSESFAGVLLLLLIVGFGIFLLRVLMSRRNTLEGPQAYETATPALPRTADPLERTARIEPVLMPKSLESEVRVPANFAVAPFLEEAKRQFRALQGAYDRGDRAALGRVMTPEMLSEITRDLDRRGLHHPTDVVMLDATLLDVTTQPDAYRASVRFSGMLREDGALLPQAFEEVWNLKKPRDSSSGWVLAGIEQREGAL
jgi:predicted lipid-binding transport protein (Tim44 family)